MYAIINAWVLWAPAVIVQTQLNQHKHGSHLSASQLNHCILHDWSDGNYEPTETC